MTFKKALGYTLISSPFVGIYIYCGYVMGFGPISLLMVGAFAFAALMVVGTTLITSD